MERDALLGHGSAFLIHDRLMMCSDAHEAYVCTHCGSLLSPTAIQRSKERRVGAGLSASSQSSATDVTVGTSGGESQLSTTLEGGARMTCAFCEGEARFKRVTLPYVFRYLVNELAGMNIRVGLKVE
jgi:DNA-directed RNA polymerase I subunit RPA2